MKWLSVLALCFVLVFALGGQLSAQTTQMTVKGILYQTGTPQVTVIDQDHWVAIVDYRGVKIDVSSPQVLALTDMSADNKLVLFGEKNVIHDFGYLTLMDKDGDKMVWQIWDTPAAGPGKGGGKIVAATGKFEGAEGTIDTTTGDIANFKDGSIYLIGHCVEKLKFKAPL